MNILLKRKDIQMKTNKQIEVITNEETIKNIIKAITNARVFLERCGKYDWFDEFEYCDTHLLYAIEELDKLLPEQSLDNQEKVIIKKIPMNWTKLE